MLTKIPSTIIITGGIRTTRDRTLDQDKDQRICIQVKVQIRYNLANLQYLDNLANIHCQDNLVNLLCQILALIQGRWEVRT